LSNEATSDKEIKFCCANFYQNETVRQIFGDIFHPGGLLLTRHLAKVLKLGQGDDVLDVACGRGASAVHLAERFGCHVTGLDYGAKNIVAAHALGEERGVSLLTSFRQGDAEGLPFDDNTFDAVISECAFCTFPDKKEAAAEMGRVLKPNGRLGLTDITIDGPVPRDIQTLLSWITCIAGADTAAGYVMTLNEAGFTDFIIQDQTQALQDLMMNVRRKLLGAEIAAGLGKLDLGDLDMEEGKRQAQRGAELIQDGTVSYTLIAARKKPENKR
jgi:ubiquinone/menaquinone biosynthesis C-methylase UbiE